MKSRRLALGPDDEVDQRCTWLGLGKARVVGCGLVLEGVGGLGVPVERTQRLGDVSGEAIDIVVTGDAVAAPDPIERCLCTIYDHFFRAEGYCLVDDALGYAIGVG